MRLKPIHAAILTLDNGEEKHVERIGKGRYSTAWKNCTSVYVQTHEDDYAKELLCHLKGTAHLPEVEQVGEDGIYRWYKMPLYQKLTAKHTRAWADFKYLRQLLKDAWAVERRNTPYNGRIQASCVNDRFEELVRGDAVVGAEYGETIESLVSWCSTYGSGWLIEELQPRNCAVDANGALILLDPVFDLDLLRAEQDKKMKKNRGY